MGDSFLTGGYVTTINGKLLENDTLKEQAANNSEQQFAMVNSGKS